MLLKIAAIAMCCYIRQIYTGCQKCLEGMIEFRAVSSMLRKRAFLGFRNGVFMFSRLGQVEFSSTPGVLALRARRTSFAMPPEPRARFGVVADVQWLGTTRFRPEGVMDEADTCGMPVGSKVCWCWWWSILSCWLSGPTFSQQTR